jgi:hypothetical protein
LALKLKNLINKTRTLVEKLYNYYIPPFKILVSLLSESELQSVINDLQKRGGLAGWMRLDSYYYTTDLNTFKKIVEWDWTDTRKYIHDVFDCDKFAFYFKSRIAIDFHINAVGIILDYSAGHAYNLVILKHNSKVAWYLYEPQTDDLFTYEQRDKKFYTMNYYYLIL